MKCESCGEVIYVRMKAALSSNTCPFCANEIMSPNRVRQFKVLSSVVSQIPLTNSKSLNCQIRERIIEYFFENFEIRPLKQDDFIEKEGKVSKEVSIVDESEVSDNSKQINIDDVPSRDLIAISKSNKKDTNVKVTTNSKFDINELKDMYKEIAAQQYEYEDDSDSLSNVSDDDSWLTPEEIEAFKNSELPANIQKKVERLKRLKGK